ncbi:Asp-tRNA(Asn)/Glu-tRNA(Gln) amidotransferase subunit GatB [Candidatus Kaiserbacteria bacterium CG06_land_8_20_14_3_00_49_31]|nr:MAG: Asp-tRNA(Asn)/Glu-tRNA(Gln) amidotransferase subunit GatB [Candidatus Kaiserbacteria bacterium CG06_land_8_20_14_3_00_49_31]
MYLPAIGLEVHAELKTRTKMFCESANDPDETRPNVNVCPICLAHPGTLPSINHEAVRHILRIGTAIGGAIADFSEFDRKSYFYPDIPKGYQISQYTHPLVTGGELASVVITRVHLEEDTARLIHSSGKSLVDFNRAGIPLMELVTEPIIQSAEAAGRFARELQLLLRTLVASEANLEKGEMRIEANISVSKSDFKPESPEVRLLGTKVEIKNLNSFRSVERAIDFEIKRQTTLIEDGSEVVQETRGWNETKQETFRQRFKEGSADYRYFPEPDLPKLFLSEISEFSPSAIRTSLPELPWERRTRYMSSYALKKSDIEYLCATPERAAFFDAIVAEFENNAEHIALAANYIVSDLAGIYAKKGEENYRTLDPAAFVKLVRLIDSHDLSSRGAKNTLAILVAQGGDPEVIAKEHGLMQVHDSVALGEIVCTIIAREEKAVREYKNGKQTALQYLVGEAMRESRGAGNPQKLQKLFVEKIK